jgi:mono/diheme cytochrome c family protein
MFAVGTAGCDLQLPGKPNPLDRPVPPNKIMSFDAIYGRNCAGCHGKDGKLGPAPPLNDQLFRAIVSASELEKVLNRGRPGTPMPPFAEANGGPLTPVQIQLMISEIKGLGISPSWGQVPSAPPSAPPYALPEASGNEQNGAKLFARNCSACHGKDGEGILDKGKRKNKINEPAFLGLISNQALRRIMITGRGDLMMPSYADDMQRPDDFQPLNSQEITDLGALLASWRKEKSAATTKQ